MTQARMLHLWNAKTVERQSMKDTYQNSLTIRQISTYEPSSPSAKQLDRLTLVRDQTKFLQLTWRIKTNVHFPCDFCSNWSTWRTTTSDCATRTEPLSESSQSCPNKASFPSPLSLSISLLLNICKFLAPVFSKNATTSRRKILLI